MWKTQITQIAALCMLEIRWKEIIKEEMETVGLPVHKEEEGEKGLQVVVKEEGDARVKEGVDASGKGGSSEVGEVKTEAAVEERKGCQKGSGKGKEAPFERFLGPWDI